VEKPRVLHVDSGRNWRGGQRQVFLLARGLRDSGYDTMVAAPPDSPLLQRVQTAGVHSLPLLLRGEWDLSSARALRKTARQWGADVIHAHDARSHSIAILALTGTRARKLVVTRRVVFAPKQVRIKYGRRVSAFIAISNAVRNAMIEAGIPAGRIEVVHSGVPAPDAAPARDWRGERGWPANTVICGIVGAMTREKGLDSVASIARRLPGDLFRRTRIVLLGGPGKGGNIIAGVEGYDAGFVENIHPAVAGLDLLWHPARSEGLGTAVIDAMALGVPPIVFATGGLPEVVEDGKSGRLIAPGDIHGFATAAAELIANAELRKAVGAAAQEKAREFDSAHMIQRTAAVYERVTAG